MDKKVKLLKSIRDVLVLILCAILFSTCCQFVVAEANAHENEKYKHQVGGLVQYGGNYIGAGIKRIWINAEHTRCVDTIFNHDLTHLSPSFFCDENLNKVEGD